MSVEMGQAKVGEQLPEWVEGAILRAVHVDVGNPHVVLHWGGEALPGLDQPVEIGARIDSATTGGANVQDIARPQPGDVEKVVYVRGRHPLPPCANGPGHTSDGDLSGLA